MKKDIPIDIPPILTIGFLWIFLSFGLSTMLYLTPNILIIGVNKSEKINEKKVRETNGNWAIILKNVANLFLLSQIFNIYDFRIFLLINNNLVI